MSLTDFYTLSLSCQSVYDMFVKNVSSVTMVQVVPMIKKLGDAVYDLAQKHYSQEQRLAPLQVRVDRLEQIIMSGRLPSPPA